jgi:hypothetical protein
MSIARIARLPASAVLVKAIARTVAKHIKAQTAPLLARIEALEASGPRTLLDSYRGTWKAGQDYPRGCLATHNGSLWFAHESTCEAPGKSPTWQMCVRGGTR